MLPGSSTAQPEPMSTFDHPSLIRDINESLAPFRKGQPEAMAGFG